MARKLKVYERYYDRQYGIINDDKERELSWDDYYIEFSGYFGNIGPHVFAAAPDILDALEYLVDNCVLAWDADWPDGTDPLSVARAAISKARGKAQ